MHILIAYFSYTSNVQTLAQLIESRWRGEHEITVSRVLPTTHRPYWNWLIRSFIPGSRVATTAVPARIEQFERICLGFPKWTFSCPPLNDYLSRLADRPRIPFGLFMSFGGFDEDRYLAAMARKVSQKGPVAVTLAVRRRLIDSAETLSAVDSFCRALMSPGSSPVRLKVDGPR